MNDRVVGLAWLSVPLLAVLSACWWWFGGIGIMPGRSVLVVLAMACVIGALRRSAAVPLGWTSPLPWLVAALVWQVVSLTWSPLPLAGATIIAERLLALAAALGLFWSLGGQAAPVAVVAGAAIVALDAGAGPWLGPWLGQDPPFGNPNFNAAAAPLLVLGLARWHCAGRSERIAVVLGLAALAGLVGLHGTRSVLLIIPVGLAVYAGLRWLPRAVHLPVFGSGLLVALTVQAVVALQGVGGLPPSWEQRRHLWTAAGEAWASAPLQGHGVGSAITLLTAGPAADRAWLSVPSWPEHAHQELLQQVVEGGLINLALLATGLVLTVAVCWRRRDEPAARALLAAWAAVVAHALVESHLAQPGPLACVALLAAATWALSWSAPANVTPAAIPRAALAVIGILGLGLAAADFGPGGSYPMLDRRARVAWEKAEQARDWAAAAQLVGALRARVGPLDDLPLIEGRLRARSLEYSAAQRLAREQAERLPVVPGTLDLLRRLAERSAKRGDHAEAAVLGAAWTAASARITSALAAVPASPKSAEARAALLTELAAPPRSADDLLRPRPATE
jgi:O-antigen ligase